MKLSAVVPLGCLCLALAAPRPPLAASGIRFRETAVDWGLDFRHRHCGTGERYMVETMVGGVVLFDFDGDGDDDVFFADGDELPGYVGPEPRSRLFRNDGDGAFVDVSDTSGVEAAVYSSGGAAGDADGDGDPDLYVTAFGDNLLYRNNGDGTFVDVTQASGTGDATWSASAAFADLDLDGDLDLYVANYVDFALDNHKFCGNREAMVQGYCHPDVYNGMLDTYYRNNGDGTFTEATAEAGFDTANGAGLGVVVGDLTNDGWPDLYVANDLHPNLVFINRGDGTFTNESLLSGAAYGDQGRVEAGMGVDLSDVDGNGFLDILVCNFELETNGLYQNMGDSLFLEGRFASGLAEPSLLKLAFGVTFADFDHDGDEDVIVANGHINDNADELQLVSPFKQQNQVFENVGGGRFQEASDVGLEVIRASRGMARGDLDLDGDQDVLVVNSDDVAEVYENVSPGLRERWLAVELMGSSSNRSGIGTRVELASGDTVQIRERRTASSYLSQSSLTVHFGLGETTGPDSLTLRWPGGKVQTILAPPAGRRLVVWE